MTTTPEWSIGYNDHTSYYEVHAAGCRHLSHPKFTYVYRGDRYASQPSASAVASLFESENEGCFTKLGPCAR